MKKKLTEKDLTQIVQKVLKEVQTFEPLFVRERKRQNTNRLFEVINKLQSIIRTEGIDEQLLDDIILILESEVEYLKSLLSKKHA